MKTKICKKHRWRVGSNNSKIIIIGAINKECKEHKWRVGSNNSKIIKNKKAVRIERVSLNIWCENCDETIKAYYSVGKKIK